MHIYKCTTFIFFFFFFSRKWFNIIKLVAIFSSFSLYGRRFSCCVHIIHTHVYKTTVKLCFNSMIGEMTKQIELKKSRKWNKAITIMSWVLVTIVFYNLKIWIFFLVALVLKKYFLSSFPLINVIFWIVSTWEYLKIICFSLMLIFKNIKINKIFSCPLEKKW